MIYSDNLLQLA